MHRKAYLTFVSTTFVEHPLKNFRGSKSTVQVFHRDYLIERNKADFSPPTFPPFILSFIELNVFKREANRVNRAEKRTQSAMR